MSSRNPTRRVILYARVSAITSRTATRSAGEARSVDDQISSLRAWAAREGHVVVAELRDDGISASRYARKSRPDWQRAMDILNAGEADLLAVMGVARATRDRPVYAALIGACIEAGAHLAVDGRVHDPADPDDGFMLDIGAAIAFQGSARIAKDTKRSVDSRAARGAPHGRVPDGYRIEYDTVTGKPLRRVIDPERGPLVREIVDRLLAGESAYGIAADFNERGITTKTGKKWLGGNIVKRVQSPTLAGRRVLNGAVLEGVTTEWPALITQEEYDRLMALFADPARKSNKEGSKVKHLLTGIALCGVCDAPVRMISGYRPNGTRRVRYSCSRGACVMRAAEPTDEVVQKALITFLSRPDVIAELTDESKDVEVREAAAEVARLQAKLADARAKAENEEISLDDFALFRSRWSEQLAAAEVRARPRWLPSVVFDVAGPHAAARWTDTPMAGRRAIVKALVIVRIHPVGRINGQTPFDPTKIEVARRER